MRSALAVAVTMSSALPPCILMQPSTYKLPECHQLTGTGWVACLCARLSWGTQRWSWKACSSTDPANFLRGTNASKKPDRWQNLHLALTGPSSCWTTKKQTLGLVELARSLPRSHGPAWNALHPYVSGFADAFAKAMIWSEGLRWNFQSLPCQKWSLKVLCMEWVMALVQDLLTKLQLLWGVETKHKQSNPGHTLHLHPKTKPRKLHSPLPAFLGPQTFSASFGAAVFGVGHSTSMTPKPDGRRTSSHTLPHGVAKN